MTFVRLFVVLLFFGISLRAQAPAIVQINLEDIVHPISAEYIQEGLDHARQVGARAVIIRVNTPGGLSDSMREIVEDVLASPVPVIVWVGPSGARASSAGFFLLLSADVATMAPGTNTGAAHPVSITGAKIEEVMEKKIVSDAAAYLRSYTAKRGRNAQLAEQGVIESKSFTDAEALQNNLIDAVMKDIPEIIQKFDQREVRRFNDRLEKLNLAGARIEVYEMSGRQRLLSRILNPNVALVLAALGLLGLYVEITHPGLILPGVVGGISLILALFAFNLLPISLAGVLLILLAIALFVLEATVASHGILALGGIIAMVVGGLMLVEAPIPELRIHLSTTLAVAIPLAIITVFLVRLVFLSHRRKAVTGETGMIGEPGVAKTDIHREGKVLVQGILWNAFSKTNIPEGSHVRVLGVDGVRIEVEAESEEKS